MIARTDLAKRRAILGLVAWCFAGIAFAAAHLWDLAKPGDEYFATTDQRIQYDLVSLALTCLAVGAALWGLAMFALGFSARARRPR